MPDRITTSGKAHSKKKRAHPEHDIQAALIKLTKRAIVRLEPLAERDPLHAQARLGLSLLHAIPNGSSRHPAEAQRLRLEGVRAGIPDLFLPAARAGYHGLYLETKAPEGSLSDAQREVIALLIEQGYKVVEFRDGRVGLLQIFHYLYQKLGVDRGRPEVEAWLLDVASAAEAWDLVFPGEAPF